MRKMICLHCNKRLISRPRGLCWTCYYQDDIRNQYPPQEGWVDPKSRDRCGNRPMPADSTTAPPGTEAKIRILQERATRMEQLFHPDDIIPPFIPENQQ